MKVTCCLKLSLGLLFVCLLGDALATAEAQQKEQRETRIVRQKNACTNQKPTKFSVKCKDRYFLGEAPTIAISITNTSRSPRTVKQAEYQKFSLELTGIFQNETGQQKKTLVYDGSWDLPKEPTRFPKPGEMHEWLAMGKREPKFVTLGPGESTNLTLDLSKTFGSSLAVDKYKLTVKSEDGQKVVKEFEVYFDDEKSFAYYAGHLKSDEELERTSAMYRLMEFSKTKAISMFKEYAKSDDEKQRVLGNWVLRKLKAGEFDALQIGVNIGDLNERLVLGQTPFVGIHIKNKGVVAKVVEAAECQQFSIELIGVFGNDSKQETKTCPCDGGGETPKQLDSFSSRAGKSVGPTQQKPKLVKLGEYESTMIVLDLSKCSRHNFETGKYQLTVKSVDRQGILKEQEIVKNFEVYFDEGKSVQVFAELVRSDDIAKRDWAVIKLAQINRTKLITVLEELAKSGNQKQRDFASEILAEVKAGNFGTNP